MAEQPLRLDRYTTHEPESPPARVVDLSPTPPGPAHQREVPTWQLVLSTLIRGKAPPLTGPIAASTDPLHLARTGYVAVASMKGGVGKTTTTLGLGATLASLRGDRVGGVDANPDRGTLAYRVERQTTATARDLLSNRASIDTYVDLCRYVNRGKHRFEVIASEADPAAAEAFSHEDYLAVIEILARHYNIVLTDTGTGLSHDAMAGVLVRADQLVVVVGTSSDEEEAGDDTLSWLEAHGHGDLVRSSVAVVSQRPAKASKKRVEELAGHFGQRCRSVVVVPHDPHLAQGGIVNLGLLRPATRAAFRRAAGEVISGLEAAVPTNPIQSQPNQGGIS